MPDIVAYVHPDDGSFSGHTTVKIDKIEIPGSIVDVDISAGLRTLDGMYVDITTRFYVNRVQEV